MTVRLIRPQSSPALPSLISDSGDRAALRFLEFFTVTIRNANTRAAYGRAAGDFLRWCEDRGMTRLQDVQPVHVAAYIERLQNERSAPTVKQYLACIRMLFDWAVTGQVMASNPAHSVRGPRHSVSKGSTPVLSSEEATALLAGMDVSHVVGLRDRAIIAVMTYTFARVGAVVALTPEDYFSRKKRWWLCARRTARSNEMPCYHKLEEYLDAYIEAAGLRGDRKEPLFRAAIGKTKKLGLGGTSRTDVWHMVRRRTADAGIETPVGCHTFRATGITDYLTNGAVSRSRSAWPDTRTPKPPASMTGVTTTSAWEKSRRSGFDH